MAGYKANDGNASRLKGNERILARVLRIKMHNKLPALVALGKYLGMFDQRTQKTNVVYAISDKLMSDEEWSKRHVAPH